MFTSEVQLWNASSLILAMDSGIVTLLSEVHQANASPPILVTLSGIAKDEFCLPIAYCINVFPSLV